VNPIRFAAVAFAAVVAAVTVAVARGQSPPPSTPVIVELFTSEGCSSCPPADQLLIALMDTQPVPGALVIGLSEHVDYWDHLGWRDPFSSAAFSRRQDAYGTAAGTGGVYTPQMIVDGGAGFVGSNRAAALAAIGRAAAAPKPPVRLSWSPGATRALDVAMDAAPQTAKADVWMAVVEDHLTSSVRRGENAGHDLTHSGVTRRLTALGTADGRGAFRATKSVDIDAAWMPANLHVIVFAQSAGPREIRAAGTIVVAR
jgi:hypothetical protein